MARKQMDSSALLLRICVFFMLICIIFFVLPYAHSCGGESCTICAIKSFFSEILLVAGLIALMPCILSQAMNLDAAQEQAASCTLVQLKVKLSD